MKREISRLNPKKAMTFKNIPPKILKGSSDICAQSLHVIFNDSVQNYSFPKKLKSADVSPLHKSEAKTSKKIIGLLAYFQWYLKSLKELCRNR